VVLGLNQGLGGKKAAAIYVFWACISGVLDPAGGFGAISVANVSYFFSKNLSPRIPRGIEWLESRD
jgi:hypothetical protein